MSKELPKHSQIVVIGGGILGCSTAYHLVRRGWQDVVLLEKAQLTSGTSWHAAGSIGQLRSSAGITEMIGYSTRLYGTLEAETGQPTGWRQCGSIRLACTPERKDELERSVIIGRSFGLEIKMIPLDEVKARIPVISLEGVLAAAHIPTDGMINPSDVTMSLAKGARMKGARIFEDTKVTGFVRNDGRVTAIETSRGTITCDKIVLCAGVWARELGRLAGVNVPLQPNYNQYAITDVIPGLPRDTPDLRDPDNYVYFKEEVGGYAYGNYDQNPKAYEVSPIPESNVFHLFEPDLDGFAVTVEDAVRRIPAMAEVGIKRFIHGLESFTEDGMPIMGEAPQLKDFYVACGFNGFGIASGGGAGKAMADWVTDGQPPYDLSAADIRRFGPHHGSDRMVKALAIDGQRRHYALARPGDEARVARMLRRGPVHSRLAAAGAHFSPVIGWEIADYFRLTDSASPADIAAAEYAAAKNTAVLADDSARAKMSVAGPEAEAALRSICAGFNGMPSDQYTPAFLLNTAGGIDCPVTIQKYGEFNFLLAAPAARAAYLHTHLQHGLAKFPGVQLLDVTAAGAVFILAGPNARKILASDFEGELAAPDGHIAPGYLAGAPVRIIGTTSFGSGFEIHVSTEYAAHIFETLEQSGASHGLRLAGALALDMLRIENGIPAIGREMSAKTKPQEIVAAAGGTSRLKQLFVRGSAIRPRGHESVLCRGKRVGTVTSSTYSPVADGSFLLAFMDSAAPAADLEIEAHTGVAPALVCERIHSEA
ncbi:MAG: FAD-dependent oxidoreductase [Rhizobiales bacterium]|nr:FAD-dependent oxidoreductase [Hyphomicrobiales bacterium]